MARQILGLGGKPINYRRPPAPTALVRWSKRDSGDDVITASFRSIAHLDHLNRLALAKYGVEIVVLQPPYNTGVAASAGTHDYDACWDLYIPGVDWWEQQRFFRANGLGAWYRHPPSFGHHIHGLTLPPREGASIGDDYRVAGFKVGKYVDGGYSLYGYLMTSSQLVDYYNHAFGLSGQHTRGSDKTWFPRRIASTIFDLNKFIAARLKEDDVVTPRKVHGADISHHQGTVDLNQAKLAGLQFLYHKATEGTTVKDDKYNGRRSAAKAIRLPFGAYHFARPEGGDAVAEAKAFLAYAKPKPGDLIPCLDLEDGDAYKRMGHARTAEWARAFSAEVERQVGVLPVLYCPWDLKQPNIRWVPRYNDSNTPPVIPWDIWQFSNGVLGVPDSFDGLGHVDLNTFRKGFTLDRLRIPQVVVTPEPEPKPEPIPEVPVEKKTRKLRMIHWSAQFSDTDAQHRSDARRVFGRGAHIITGTEAGPSSNLASILREVGEDAGYRVYKPAGGTDSWIAVLESIIDGKWKTNYHHVVDGRAKQYAGKGVVSVSFVNDDFGPISVGAAHYLTKGRKPGDPRYDLNRQLARAIGDWADEASRGKGLVLFGADTNMVDSKSDVFFGEQMTTTWDELRKYENTGHGNIDVLASHDRDKRVKALKTRAFSDKELFLHGDHFLVEGVFEIQVP